MKKKIIIIIVLAIIAIAIFTAVFVNTTIETAKINTAEVNEQYTGNIVDPDRIVYRNKEGKYFEFLSGTPQYEQLKNLISSAIKEYHSNGEIVEEETIKKLHEKAFIEFDYKTASKNYLIPLEEKQKNMIKFANTGGNICVTELKSFNKIKKEVQKLSKSTQEYTLEYTQMISRNTLDSIDYKYLQQFKEINYKIHQVKIETIEDYELYQYMCKLAFEEEITEDTFKEHCLILTISLLPKIDVEVNLGNIQYTYDRLADVNYQYTAHALVVSKIVNTDCIYHTDLSEIASKIEYDNMKTEYNQKVEQLNQDMFVTDFEKFFEEYERTNTTISEKEAEEIAQIGFEEAERVAGDCDETTQEVITKTVRPNNFFTRKMTEGDKTAEKLIEVYCFTRTDDMELNGIEIYIDKKLGKIVGASAFGD